MRAEIFYKPGCPDGRSGQVSSLISASCGQNARVVCVDVILGEIGIIPGDFASLFTDPVSQDCLIDIPLAGSPNCQGWSLLIEISYKPGVTDTLALTAIEALRHELGQGAMEGRLIHTARQYLIWLDEQPKPQTIQGMLRSLHNPLIQVAEWISQDDWKSGRRAPLSYPHVRAEGGSDCQIFDVSAMDNAQLEALSKERLLALSVEEMASIRQRFSDEGFRRERRAHGLPEAATDVEIEMIAQTWSEHCKHKIFNATIDYIGPEGKKSIDSPFKTYIKALTDRVAQDKGFLRSVFTDNAGVIAFDEDTCLCIKAETHNSPSALDPYGGAITGIVGVNRDILGTGMGAKPIFNTNVLCFGYPDTKAADLPEGLLRPDEVLRGVHKGIVDGGNQSGIPTVAGGFLFDESYTGKPLVFCGTGGILPASVQGRPSWEKRIEPGDLAIMLGGRIGKDGIHGATFSSLELSESSPVSAVQIGDPIIQRKMTDFLLEARDKGLYKGITDNGAGGLSSSLGEMAESSGGLRIDLEACPLKYPGLSPWEILVSESQERMSLAVDPATLPQFLALARRREVEASVVGEFQSSGYIDIRYKGRAVGLLDMEFLHRGLPRLQLRAEWIEPEKRQRERGLGQDIEIGAALLGLLADPNIASKESLVRQYDHEVQAMSLQKPFVGAAMDGPGDGGVIKPRYDSWKAISVTHGICPRYGDWDTYRMAQCAVDEALRAHVALGGDPDQAAALDNFCWPDPLPSPTNPDAEYKLAQLIRCLEGLREACLDYGLPLISGKDSMKNDSTLGGRRLSVRPTLLISLMGVIPDGRASLSSDFKADGDLVYLLGPSRGEMGGSSYERLRLNRATRPQGASRYDPSAFGPSPSLRATEALSLYRAFFRTVGAGLVKSAHDLSDGGLGVALAESCIGGRLGAELNLDALSLDGAEKLEGVDETSRLLFCESPGRLLVSVDPRDREQFETSLRGQAIVRVGQVSSQAQLFVRGRGHEIRIPLGDLVEAFAATLR